MILTSALKQRPRRAPDYKTENAVLIGLVEEMAKAPGEIFQRLVEAVQKLCRAQSAGISLLNKQQRQFVWPAVSGQWSAYVGGGTPRDFGPCGTVLDRDTTLLFSHPERHFTYLAAATPNIEEALLVPFHINGESVGTIWAITHDEDRHFDSEDARVLDSLSKLTSAAYRTLVEIGALSKSH